LSRIPVCQICIDSLTPAEGQSCAICGEAIDFIAPEQDSRCGPCRRLPPRFDFALSYSGYDGTLRALVHLLKYERLRPVAGILGAKLADSIAERKLEGREPVLVIPMPLYRSKQRQRGFNQSELIARSALRQLPDSRFELHGGNLARVRPTASQTGLTRHQRRENVRGAFRVMQPDRLRGRSVMIVDDVYTTGTTLNECARVVRAAGAKQVVVATVARVYRPSAEMVFRGVLPQEENAAAVSTAVAG